MKKIRPKSFWLDTNSRLAIQAASQDVVTQSEIMTRAACPRKWFYRYALKLNRMAAVSYHLVYGTLMHSALAKLYKSGHYGLSPKEEYLQIPPLELDEDIVLTPDDTYELELVKAKVQYAFDAYRWYYYKEDSFLFVRSVETDYEVSWKGIKLSGRIDLVANPNNRDGQFIWDWKTSGRFDATMLDAWSFRFQFLYYCWLYWRATGINPAGIMVNGLAKTLLRPRITNRKTKEKESVKEYLTRVRHEFRDNQAKYFYRQRMPLVQGILNRFETEMLEPHLDVFILMQKKGIDINTNVLGSLTLAMNTAHCHIYNSFCEYLPLCKDGTIMLGEYYKRNVKHQELVEVEPEVGNG